MRKSNIRLKKKGSNIEVLYEDNHIIAINKKSGDLVQGDKSRDTPLPEIVKLFLKNKYSNLKVFLFIGLIDNFGLFFCKNFKVLKRLNNMIKN